YESLQMFFTIVAAQGLDFWLIDFIGTYLNAKSENYMNLSQEYEEIITRDLSPDDYILKMHHVIYRTMNASNAWFNKLNKSLIALGYIQS
ncbi:uncharacterized protein BT62DRAFT_913800, partial [Guyanagaster necrorhizus]